MSGRPRHRVGRLLHVGSCWARCNLQLMFNVKNVEHSYHCTVATRLMFSVTLHTYCEHFKQQVYLSAEIGHCIMLRELRLTLVILDAFSTAQVVAALAYAVLSYAFHAMGAPVPAGTACRFAHSCAPNSGRAAEMVLPTQSLWRALMPHSPCLHSLELSPA